MKNLFCVLSLLCHQLPSILSSCIKFDLPWFSFSQVFQNAFNEWYFIDFTVMPQINHSFLAKFMLMRCCYRNTYNINSFNLQPLWWGKKWQILTAFTTPKSLSKPTNKALEESYHRSSFSSDVPFSSPSLPSGYTCRNASWAKFSAVPTGAGPWFWRLWLSLAGISMTAAGSRQGEPTWGNSVPAGRAGEAEKTEAVHYQWEVGASGAHSEEGVWA